MYNIIKSIKVKKIYLKQRKSPIVRIPVVNKLPI